MYDVVTLMEVSSMSVNNEVTAADIARIAGVGRAAVSNWRRRHPDFPSPVGGPATSPTFAWPEVESWLTANGRAASKKLTGTKATDVLALAEAMAALVPSSTRGLVLDPACGDGTLLAEVAQLLGPRVRYVGRADDMTRIDVAKDALADADATNVEITVADDQFAALKGQADAVVSITPGPGHSIDGAVLEYGQPSRGDHALGWVQICLACLKRGGTAIVAVPFSAAVRASARRIRAELLRAGVLTEVIALPERAVNNTAAPWQIWKLTRPADRPAYVLRMVDLTDRDADNVPHDPEAWAAVFADPTRTRNVPSIELLDEDVLLVPATHLPLEVRDLTPDYHEARERYSAAIGRLGAEAPSLAAGSGEIAAQLVSVGDLVRSGALTIVDRERARPGDVVVPSTSGDFAAVVLNAVPAVGIKAASVIRCDPDSLDPYFLACFLRSATNRRQAAGTSGGTF
ncbi:N-6 DNA methylase, partial [Actinoplanes sp. NPDC051633]|uniref:N-6 DNA methylase n=1 Tax=Actinoplanes sp. NPDC051633 TaxID=3155670 RepID=UPI0034450AF9